MTLLDEFENLKKDNETFNIEKFINSKQGAIGILNPEKDNSIEVTNTILNDLKIDKINISTLKFIFHELIGNIYDHSNFKNAAVIGNENSKYFEFSFIDDGITIPKSLKNEMYTLKNDCECVIEALNGLSTKNYMGFIERGTGLNNSSNIVINGSNGEFLIASGLAMIFMEKNKIITKNLSTPINGTLIIIRMNLDKKIDIYKYLKQVKYDVIL